MNAGIKPALPAGADFCRAVKRALVFFAALCCALPPAVTAAAVQYALCNSRFGLAPILLRRAGMGIPPALVALTRAGLETLWRSAFFYTLCCMGLLILALRAKKKPLRATALALLALFTVANITVALWVLRLSFSTTRDIFALRLFVPPRLAAYAAVLSGSLARPLLAGLLCASLASLVAALLFILIQKRPDLPKPPARLGARLLAPAVFIAAWNCLTAARPLPFLPDTAGLWHTLFELAKKLRYTGNWPDFFAALILTSLPPLIAAVILISNWRNHEKQRDF